MLPNPNTVATLATYIRPEDGALTRDQFLEAVASRIHADIAQRLIDPAQPGRVRIMQYLQKAKGFRTTSQISNACYITMGVARRYLWELAGSKSVEALKEAKIAEAAGNPILWRSLI